jgi:hypothetical protein
MSIDDPGEDIGEVGKRIDVVQLTGFDQRGDNGPVLGAAVRACEQRIFPVECDRMSIGWGFLHSRLQSKLKDRHRIYTLR